MAKTLIELASGIRRASVELSTYFEGLMNAADAAAVRTALSAAALNVAQAFTKGQRSAPVALSISSGVVAIDASASNIFTLSLTENVTSVTLSNLAAGTNFDLHITQDATGGRTVVGWAAAFKWPGGTAPTITSAANAEDFISFESADGTTVKGFYAQDFG
ncbi:MAG: hypothetical protein AAF215_05195 [Cyanobacteria bacterium P01_A01_bin.123]